MEDDLGSNPPRSPRPEILVSQEDIFDKMAESGTVQPLVLEDKDWIQQWTENDISLFHMECVNPTLNKHISIMLDGRSNLRILFPLCGKVWDMKWLADQGHTVIGVEVAQKAIEEFFEEQKVSFTSQSVPAVDGTLFQSTDQKIQLYCCDFFKLSPEVTGRVDAVWDRGSLVAVNVFDRARYVAVVQSLMAPGCRYLLAAMQYDETKYPGPPHHLGDETVRELFENNCNVKEIAYSDFFGEKQKKWGLDWFIEKVFLITPK